MGDDYEAKLVAWVKKLDTGSALAPEGDHSKGIGGTKEDSQNEKAAGELLRGGADGKEEDEFRVEPCTCKVDDEGEHAKDCTGKWIKTLNKQKTCYLFVHTITHMVTGTTKSRS